MAVQPIKHSVCCILVFAQAGLTTTSTKKILNILAVVGERATSALVLAPAKRILSVLFSVQKSALVYSMAKIFIRNTIRGTPIWGPLGPV